MSRMLVGPLLGFLGARLCRVFTAHVAAQVRYRILST
jgi:hypothetical protein